MPIEFLAGVGFSPLLLFAFSEVGALTVCAQARVTDDEASRSGHMWTLLHEVWASPDQKAFRAKGGEERGPWRATQERALEDAVTLSVQPTPISFLPNWKRENLCKSATTVRKF